MTGSGKYHVAVKKGQIKGMALKLALCENKYMNE